MIANQRAIGKDHTPPTKGNNMSKSNHSLSDFSQAVIESGQLWVLSADDEFVVVDSIEFDDTDVMPIFSEQNKAQALCVEDWSSYQAVAIDLESFFEEWLPGLDQDQVMLALDLDVNLVGDEIEPFKLAKQLAKDEL